MCCVIVAALAVCRYVHRSKHHRAPIRLKVQLAQTGPILNAETSVLSVLTSLLRDVDSKAVVGDASAVSMGAALQAATVAGAFNLDLTVALVVNYTRVLEDLSLVASPTPQQVKTALLRGASIWVSDFDASGKFNVTASGFQLLSTTGVTVAVTGGTLELTVGMWQRACFEHWPSASTNLVRLPPRREQLSALRCPQLVHRLRLAQSEYRLLRPPRVHRRFLVSCPRQRVDLNRCVRQWCVAVLPILFSCRRY